MNIVLFAEEKMSAGMELVNTDRAGVTKKNSRTEFLSKFRKKVEESIVFVKTV